MKKILIILESHIDHVSTAAEVGLIDHLKKVGFDTLGLEFPKSGKELVEILETTLKVSNETYLKSSLQCLFITHKLRTINGKPINSKTLLDMDFLSLAKLLMEYVSSRKYAELARILLSIRGTRHKLDMIKVHGDSMEIVGVDSNLTSKESATPNIDNYGQRETGMADNIENLFKQGKKAIHIMGKSHASGMVKILAEKELLEHTVFLDLKSPITMIFDKNYLDFSSINKHILHPIMVTPDAGIEPQLEHIYTLVEMEPPKINLRNR